MTLLSQTFLPKVSQHFLRVRVQQKPYNVPHQQLKGVFGRNTEVLPINGDLTKQNSHLSMFYDQENRLPPETGQTRSGRGLQNHSSPHHDVGVPVQELDELLQTPEAALHAAQDETGTRVLCSCRTEPSIFSLTLNSDYLHQGQDQSSKRQGADVVPAGRRETKHRDVARLVEGPVVGGEGARQRALPQGNDKVDAPEKSDGVVDLQVEEVPLEEPLLIVGDEDAPG
uniref:Uncharacterized protein n=1 Tax=Oryzias sinensis TaxID=183150 RepID=A0A8C7X0L9_9TELE